MTDDIAYPRMASLIVQVEAVLRECNMPGVCRASVVPGVMAVLEACGNCTDGKCTGQAWARLMTAYPSDVFPQPLTDAENCNAPMAVQIEVGIARCLPVGSTGQLSGFIPPSVDEQTRATKQQMDDMQVMLTAIRRVAEDADVAYALGSYQTINTQADCGGGVWTVTFWSQ